MIYLEIKEIPEIGTSSRLISITFLDNLFYISKLDYPMEFIRNIVSVKELWEEMKYRNLGPKNRAYYLKICTLDEENLLKINGRKNLSKESIKRYLLQRIENIKFKVRACNPEFIDDLDFMTEEIGEFQNEYCLFSEEFEYNFGINLSKKFEEIFSEAEISIRHLDSVELTMIMEVFQIVQSKEVII